MATDGCWQTENQFLQECNPRATTPVPVEGPTPVPIEGSLMRLIVLTKLVKLGEKTVEGVVDEAWRRWGMVLIKTFYVCLNFSNNPFKEIVFCCFSLPESCIFATQSVDKDQRHQYHLKGF